MRRGLMGRMWIVAVVGLAGVGCSSSGAEWRQRYLDKERDAVDLQSQLSDERNARATAVQQLEEANTRIGELDVENAALKEQIAGASTAAAAPSNDGIARTLRDLTSGGLSAYQTADGNISIVLASDVTFSPGSKDLSAEGRKAVDTVATEIKSRFPGFTIRVEGHTDADPIRKSPFKDNWELGAERALTVSRYLEQKHGLDGTRLVPSSRGQTLPVAENKSDAGKSKNRRVEVIVVMPREAAAAK